MSLRISGLFRSDHVNYDPLLPPSRKNPGGVVGTLVVNLRAALPSLEIIHDISQAESINITESKTKNWGRITVTQGQERDERKATLEFFEHQYFLPNVSVKPMRRWQFLVPRHIEF